MDTDKILNVDETLDVAAKLAKYILTELDNALQSSSISSCPSCHTMMVTLALYIAANIRERQLRHDDYGENHTALFEEAKYTIELFTEIDHEERETLQ